MSHGIQGNGKPDANIRRVSPREIVVRRHLVHGTVADMPESSGMRLLYDWWKHRLARTGFATASHKNAEIVPDILGLDNAMHVLACDAEDPRGYQIRRYGRSSTETRGRDLTGFRLAEVPGTVYRNGLMEDYHHVKKREMPLLTRVSWTQIGGDIENMPLSHSYSRIIVPLSSNGHDIDRLLVCVQREHNVGAGLS